MPEQKEGTTGAAQASSAKPAPSTISGHPLKRFKWVKVAIVILAIILIIGGPAGFFIYEQRSFDNTFNAVQTQLELCLDNAVKNGILRVAVQGGRASISEIAYTKQSQYDAEYLYFNGVSRVPSELQFSSEIGSFARAQMDECARQVSSSEVSVSASEGSVGVALGATTVATTDYVYTIQNRLFGREINQLRQEVPIDVRTIIGPVRDIVDHVGANGGISDLSIVQPDGHSVTYVLYPEDETIVFLVRSENQKVDGVALSMLLAVDTHQA